MKVKTPSSTRARFESVIARQFGLDMTATRAAEVDRILLPSARRPFSDPEAYVAWLESLPEEHPEWAALAARLTVGETYFFRDRGVFEALARHVLPAIIAGRRARGALSLRVWSAGCATGEEPYSLAILLDRLLPDRRDWALTILATDINAEALARAAHGVYRGWALRATDPDVRRRYFEARDEAVEVDPEIRRMVSFAPLNLRSDAFPDPLTNTGAMDVILCRNVLIHFTPEAQRSTAARLARALVPEGWVVPGPAEASADIWAPLLPANFPEAILFHGGHAQRRPLPRTPDTTTVLVPRCHDAGARSASLALTPFLAQPAPVLAGAPDRPALLDEARRVADGGRLAEARALCEIAVAREPFDAEARVLLGAICQEQEDLHGAREALRAALYLAPDLAAAHLLLGMVQGRAGEFAAARRSMNVIIRLLDGVGPQDVVAVGSGLTAGRLLATARTYLTVLDQDRSSANGA